MSHEIDMSRGRAAIAYAGQTPWHRLGTKFDDLMTSQQALKAAELDFTVTKEQAYYLNADGQPVVCPDRFITVRNDTGAGLGAVGSRYVPVQNHEAFSFMDSLVGTGEMKYEVAGALYGGKLVWMLGKLPQTTRVHDEDVIDHYLLMSNGHDGLTGCSVAFTTVRVVCANTFRLAHAGKLKLQYKIRHTGDIKQKLDEAQTVLGLAKESADFFTGRALALSVKDVKTQAKVDEFIHSVLGVKGPDDMTKPQKKVKERIKELAATGMGSDLASAKDTYWGLFNAVTEFVDHERASRDSEEEGDGRVHAVTWGGGDAMKQRAWETALALI